MNIADLASKLGVTVADIAEIYNGTDPEFTDGWIIAKAHQFFRDTHVTPKGEADITARVQEVTR